LASGEYVKKQFVAASVIRRARQRFGKHHQGDALRRVGSVLLKKARRVEQAGVVRRAKFLGDREYLGLPAANGLGGHAVGVDPSVARVRGDPTMLDSLYSRELFDWGLVEIEVLWEIFDRWVIGVHAIP
jgi:hypothetical protein